MRSSAEWSQLKRWKEVAIRSICLSIGAQGGRDSEPKMVELFVDRRGIAAQRRDGSYRVGALKTVRRTGAELNRRMRRSDVLGGESGCRRA